MTRARARMVSKYNRKLYLRLMQTQLSLPTLQSYLQTHHQWLV